MSRGEEIRAGVRLVVSLFFQDLVKPVGSRHKKGRAWRELHGASTTTLKELTVEVPLA
jgi:hypothetical protein